MSGFITMHRDALDHPLLKDADRFRAWFWLIANACWKPTKVRIKGEVIELQRGEMTFSQRFLAEKWGWSKSRVDRFMSDLRDHGMIETRQKNGATNAHAAGQGQAVISICNYAKYQDLGDGVRGNDEPPARGNSGATAGQQRGKEEPFNHLTMEEEPNGSPSSRRASSAGAFPMPEWADPDVWSDFLKNRKAKRLPSTATAHRKFLKDIEALADPQWPPGRLLEEIVARGWGAAYDPRPKDYQNGNQHQAAGRTPAGYRGAPRRDDFSREIDEQGGFAGPFEPSGPSGRWDG